MNTPLNLLWSLNYLTQKFLEDISKLEYDDIIPLIIQLLIGDFNNAIKKKKLVNLRDPNQKICSFYLLPIKKNSNDNILFCLCLEGKNYISSSIHFLSISRNWDFEEIAQEFLKEINNDKNIPLVEYDQNGLFLVDEILFSHKEKDELSGRIICYPLFKVNITNNAKPEGGSHGANGFKNNDLNESIINQIEDNQYDKRIISLIEMEENCWEYKLSQQEKNYVINSDTFILSGRPGTGKTTVILFKLLIIIIIVIIKIIVIIIIQMVILPIH